MALPTIGTKGGYRAMDSSSPLTLAEVASHQDTGFVALKKANGKFFRANEQTGKEEGEADSPGYAERVSFSTSNIFLARPAKDGQPGAVVPYEWYNL